jgi:DNA invertase Pin-like site-specific DNA recombinase
MARVGYARVSSVGQSLEVQLDKLAHCACDKTYQEKKSGSGDGGKRPGLEACLEYVREGDTLLVTRLDRLARSTLHLCQIAAELQRKGVELQVLDQQIDTATSTGRLLFHMLGAIAQFETEIRAERQRDGIEHAKARSVPARSSQDVNAIADCCAARGAPARDTHSNPDAGLPHLQGDGLSLPRAWRQWAGGHHPTRRPGGAVRRDAPVMTRCAVR